MESTRFGLCFAVSPVFNRRFPGWPAQPAVARFPGWPVGRLNWRFPGWPVPAVSRLAGSTGGFPGWAAQPAVSRLAGSTGCLPVARLNQRLTRVGRLNRRLTRFNRPTGSTAGSPGCLVEPPVEPANRETAGSTGQPANRPTGQPGQPATGHIRLNRLVSVSRPAGYSISH